MEVGCGIKLQAASGDVLSEWGVWDAELRSWEAWCFGVMGGEKVSETSAGENGSEETLDSRLMMTSRGGEANTMNIGTVSNIKLTLDHKATCCFSVLYLDT